MSTSNQSVRGEKTTDSTSGRSLALSSFVAETLKSFNANARAKNINEDDIDAEVTSNQPSSTSDFDQPTDPSLFPQQLVNQQKAAVSQFQTEHDDEDGSVKKSTKTKVHRLLHIVLSLVSVRSADLSRSVCAETARGRLGRRDAR